MFGDANQDVDRNLAEALDELRPLHLMCREGRLYNVEHWIAEGKPLQLAPEAIAKRARPKTALQIALETGQHSLALLLLRNGYRVDLERYAPLDLALDARRWDLFDLLLDWGADLKSADVYTVLETYNVDLYERCRAAGYDLTQRHEMASILGRGTSNRPLLGFVKRHRLEDSKVQLELNIALGYHARAGNEKGVKLALWAGADPHAPTPNPELETAEGEDSEEEEEGPTGWSAIEEAASAGHLDILRRLGPDPERDAFDHLYRYARNESIVEFLAGRQPPKDLSSILSWQAHWLGDRFPGSYRGGAGTIEALLACGVRWSEASTEQIAEFRRGLLQAGDYDLKRILSRLKKLEICATETYQELTRTPRMQERLITIGFAKKPISKREERSNEVARLMSQYDRPTLYDQVWSEPIPHVAQSYGISKGALGNVCRKLRVPVPPRGHWARVQNGVAVERPPLPAPDGGGDSDRKSPKRKGRGPRGSR